MQLVHVRQSKININSKNNNNNKVKYGYLHQLTLIIYYLILYNRQKVILVSVMLTCT